MKLLVTGGTGFAMSHVVREFLRVNPGANAVVLDNFPIDASIREFYEHLANQIEIIQGDVGDSGVWDRVAQHDDFTHIVHGATVTSIASRLEYFETLAQRNQYIQHSLATNLMGTVYCLGLGLQQKNLKRLVNVSSGSVYSAESPIGPLPEDGFTDPVGFYPASKYSGELLVASYADQFDLPGISVRLSGVYGPMDRQTPGRDVRCVPYRIAHGAMAHRAGNGDTLLINDLNAIGDFIHATDVAKAIVGLLGAATLNYGVYNIAYGEAVSVGQLIDIVQAQFPELLYKIVDPDEADVFLDPSLNRGRFGPYSIKRVSQDTHWKPIAIEIAMTDYLQWLKQHPY